MKAFRAIIKHALSASQVVEYQDGLLLIDTQGRIAACGHYAELAKKIPVGCQIYDKREKWLVPGFVDCHVHLPQLDCRHKNGLTLLDWLKTYIYPAEAQFSDPHVAQQIALRFYDELLSHGITTAAIHSTVHFAATDIAFQVAEEKGIRAIIGQVLMDQNAPSELLEPKNKLLSETEKLIAKWHGKNQKLFYAVTPRFALTCSKDLICDAGKLAAQAKVYFQTHLAETVEEVAQARELFHFNNYPAFYEKNFCLGEHSLFAHCVHLQEDEWKLLAKHSCAIAHCPTSNVFLKSGTMPFAAVEKHKLRCGLGSDVGAGPTFSMCEISDCALDVHSKHIMNNQKAFYLATLGGAAALSLQNEIGNFVEGKWADFSLFDNKALQGSSEKTFVAGNCVWSKKE